MKDAAAAERKAAASAGFLHPKTLRYRERSTVERVNARLKDEFGGRHLRVRGHAKAQAHLMYGILAPAVDQLMRSAL